MTACVLDASVVVRWFIGHPDEPSVEKARKLLHEYGAGRLEIHAPDLLPIEFANALWKSVRFGEADPTLAAAMLRQLLEYEIVLHHSTSFILDALQAAVEHRITAYDAAYLAVAARLGVPLYTADRKLHAAASLTVSSVLVI